MTVTITVEALSYGGGLDSWTMLLRSVTDGCPPDLVIFADVGDEGVPGEWPSTMRHIAEVAMPFAAAHGIEWVTLTGDFYPLTRGGQEYRSLYDYALAKRMFFGATQHLCTIAGKIDRIAAYLDDRYPDQDVNVWIGFTAGEEKRAARDPRGPNASTKHSAGKARRRSRYPLVEWAMCRCREEVYCRASGLPVPRKSACTFCPKASRNDFTTLQSERPDIFAMVALYERGAKKTRSGKTLKMSGTGDGAAWLGDWAAGRKVDGSAMRPFAYKRIPCHVCGAKQRATKATGCTYLSDAT